MLSGHPDAYPRLNDGAGITRAYAGGGFGLFCLLPPEGQPPEKYLAGISGAGLRDAHDVPTTTSLSTIGCPSSPSNAAHQAQHGVKILGSGGVSPSDLEDRL